MRFLASALSSLGLVLLACACSARNGDASPAGTPATAAASTAAADVPAATSGPTVSQSAFSVPPPGPPRAPPAAVAAHVGLELVTDATKEATALVAAPEPPGRLFVVEKAGLIRILRGKKLEPKPFLDIRVETMLDRRDNGEQGLLGLAFHPQFAKNRRFYINYTARPDGQTRVEEWRVTAKAHDRADSKTRRVLLKVDQPYSNHNAGDLAFGPDGKLYVGLGDGGSAHDPHGHGQNAESLLGNLLRFDVEARSPAPETVAIGLRNPWRISFDHKTGDLYIADVGQNLWEYIHVLTAQQLASAGKLFNLGWNRTEGFHCFKADTCDTTGLQAPVLEYDHKTGCSITGGYVYRGKALPELDGRYFYADYCTALVRSLRLEGGKVAESWDWKPVVDEDNRLARVASFGEDQDGELYVVTHEGPVYKLIRKP
jgi:glucose/arabinose dehydrogenase